MARSTVGAIDARRAESNVRFNGAGKEKGILEHDAELAAEILQVDQANVFAVEEDLAALNVVKTEQEGDESGFASAGMTDDSVGLPGATRKETSRKTQSSSAGSGHCSFQGL